jgi:hypothetical protein
VTAFSLTGAKSDDVDSPAYAPSLFSFTPHPKKRQMECGLSRWESLQKRRDISQSTEATTTNSESDNTEESGPLKSAHIQTNMTMWDISALETDNMARQEEIAVLKKQCDVGKTGYPTEEQLKGDDKLVTFYTGLSTFTTLIAIYEFVVSAIPQSANNKVSAFDSYVMTLMKLRLNLSTYDLAFRFGVSVSTVSRILKKWIFAMDLRIGSALIKWPSREALQRTMPFCFRVHYGLRVIAIIDCFEIFIEKPSNLQTKYGTWSQYKHYNTAKYLIAITPQGVISFISKGWGGRASDKFITEHCGLLTNILPGDVILADRGFNIEESIGSLGASLKIPAFTKGRDQLTAIEVEKTRHIANVRIHVERVIGSVRQRFTILSATGVIAKEFYQQKVNGVIMLDAMVRVCCALNNMCGGIVPFE